MTDEEAVLEVAGKTVPEDRVRFWHRIGVASTRLLLYSLIVVFLRLFVIFITNNKSEAGLFTKCMGLSALAAFVIGTFLADLWVLRALTGVTKPESADGAARQMGSMSSLLLTGRLHSLATDSVKRDMLSFKALLLLFATIISVFLLILLWP